MPWYKVEFDYDQTINCIHNKVSEQCRDLISDDKKALIVFQKWSAEKGCTTFYISQEAYDILNSFIKTYNPIKCEQPPKVFSHPIFDRIGFECGDFEYFKELYGSD